MLTVVANIAYVLMLCAFIARDVLYLRLLLVMAQAIIAFYSWHNGVLVIAGWNVVFVAINCAMTVQILRERRAVTLPAELTALYERHFAALSPAEFLRWWHQGERQTISDQRLVSAGERPEWLYFLLSGSVSVSRRDAPITSLPAGYFVAEMSLLTGAPANADVHTAGSIDVIRWSTASLHDLRQRKPALWTKIQSAIGHDLVEKIRLGEERAHA
jgi:CRP-like cAMP-binding protein